MNTIEKIKELKVKLNTKNCDVQTTLSELKVHSTNLIAEIASRLGDDFEIAEDGFTEYDSHHHFVLKFKGEDIYFFTLENTYSLEKLDETSKFIAEMRELGYTWKTTQLANLLQKEFFSLALNKEHIKFDLETRSLTLRKNSKEHIFRNLENSVIFESSLEFFARNSK